MPAAPRFRAIFGISPSRGEASSLHVNVLLVARSSEGRAMPRRAWREGGVVMIRKLADGHYRLYSRKVNPKAHKRRNLGTFDTRTEAEQHEREVQFFKRRH
jgi:hypothetical protein